MNMKLVAAAACGLMMLSGLTQAAEIKVLASGAIMAAELDEGKPLNVAVKVREDLIPEALRPDRFLAAMVNAVIDRTPINLHEEVRKRLGQEVPEEEGVTGAYDSESNDAVD